MDCIEKNSTFKKGFDQAKFQHVVKWEKYLQEMNIPFTFHVNKDSLKLEYRDLTGPEKLKLIQNIQISKLLTENATAIQSLWDDFAILFAKLKSDYDDNDSVAQLRTTIIS